MAKLTSSSTLRSAKGMKLPVVGLGTWQTKDEVLESALDLALEAGYRLIDTAFMYQNEAVIGRVLNKWISSGKLKRDDVFITTKLPMTGNRPEKVRHYLLSQLKALQLDYVDLYLIHNPVGLEDNEATKKGDYSKAKLDMTTDLVALWKEMEKQVDEGLTKHVGVSNFNTGQIERLLRVARIPPANLQIELYLYQQAREEREFCRKHGITITSYGTLGSPAAPSAVLLGCNDNPLEDATVKRIAAAHNKNAGQVLLRHALQLGIAVIPKSSNPERLKQNLQVFDFELTEGEMKELNSLDRGEAGRRFIVSFFQGHPELAYPSPSKQP